MMQHIPANYIAPTPVRRKATMLIPSGLKPFFKADDWNLLQEYLQLDKKVDIWSCTEPEWLKYLARLDSEILFTGWESRQLPANLRQINPGIRYICHLTGEIKYFLPREIIESGILVTNWGGAISPQVAEAALMLILACLRNLYHYQEILHNQNGWNLDKPARNTLFGKKVGIHGFGQVARSLCRLIQPWECSLFAYSDGVPVALLEDYGVTPAENLDDLFENCQIVVELESLRQDSMRSVKEHHLRSLGKDGVFVNVGRGAVVDEEGLVKVAKEGNLRIGLDVFWKEPLPRDYPLRGLKNVILLPHVAGPTPDYLWKCGGFALENIQRYISGNPPEALIDLKRYDTIT